MEDNQIPRNCRECDKQFSCFRSWYGGKQCKYQKEIRQVVIREVLSAKGDDANEQQPPCGLYENLEEE